MSTQDQAREKLEALGTEVGAAALTAAVDWWLKRQPVRQARRAARREECVWCGAPHDYAARSAAISTSASDLYHRALDARAAAAREEP